MEISLENLYVDIGAERVKFSYRFNQFSEDNKLQSILIALKFYVPTVIQK